MKLVEWMNSELIQHGSAKAPNYEEELMAFSLTELFHDFLITGTLGSTQPIIQVTEDYPSTPTFSISIYDEYSQASSSEKYNHDSSVTETVEACENEEIICPLQSYLLARAELPVTKERRLSLGELFQKANVADECSGSRSDDGATQLEKEANKSAAHFMRKLMLKNRMFHPSSGRAIGSLRKILHIFDRKVHPESSTFSYQSHKSTEINEITNNITHFPALENEEIWPSAEDIKLYFQGATLKESTSNESHSSQFTRIRGNASVKELWIKTDADYLVLELLTDERTKLSGSI